MKWPLLALALAALATPTLASSSYEHDGALAPGTFALGGADSYNLIARAGDVVDVRVAWDDALGPLRVAVHDGVLVDDCPLLGATKPCSPSDDLTALRRLANEEDCGIAHETSATSPIVLHAVFAEPQAFGHWITVQPFASAATIPYHLSVQLNGESPNVYYATQGQTSLETKPACGAWPVLARGP